MEFEVDVICYTISVHVEPISVIPATGETSFIWKKIDSFEPFIQLSITLRHVDM